METCGNVINARAYRRRHGAEQKGDAAGDG
jgi:hypothetical protein